MEINQIASEVYAAILRIYEPKLHRIGSQLRGDAVKLSLGERGGRKYIYYKGDFKSSLDYRVEILPNMLRLTVQSGVQHAPYVLGGKVPSWTPIEPLKTWVEYKKLAWTDRVTGKALSVTQMAWMIAGKIKREGIPERNVWQEVVREKEGWIIGVLNGS